MMRTTRQPMLPILLGGVLCAVSLAAAQQKFSPNTWILSAGTNKWSLLVDLPGFVPQRNTDGGVFARRSFMARNPQTGVVVTAMALESGPQLSAAACRTLYLRILPSEQRPSVSHTSDRPPFAFAEYSLPSKEQPGATLHVFSASLTEDGLCATVQFGTTAASAPGAFDSILSTAHLEKDAPPSSFALMLRADREYAHSGSNQVLIKPYSAALELEKVSPRLEPSRWFTLVHQLALTQCWSGHPKEAAAAANDGLARESTNPLFFYDLACAAAREKDESGSLADLRKMFALKDHLPAGEHIMDPRRDDVFDRFMTQPEFRQEIDSLTAELDEHLFDIPGQSWKLAMTLPTFSANSAASSKGSYVFIKDDHKRFISAAVTITPSASPATPQGCLASLEAFAKQNRAKGSPPYQAGQTAMLEYNRQDFDGYDYYYNSRVLLTCTPRELVYLFVEFSSPGSFQEADRALFTQILNSIHAVQPPSTSGRSVGH